MSDEKKIVIFGVLNWGLGHATRSIPLIKALQRHGFEVVLASDDGAADLLKEEFPQLIFEELPAYNIRYGNSLWLSMALQLPKIVEVSRRENKSLKKLVKKYRPIGVISDSRFGFYSKKVPSVYVSHQLKLMTPFMRKLISARHHSFIAKYNECWIPDVKEKGGLTGEMGHSLKPDVPCRYVGWLSRFQASAAELPKKYRACAILSGPEPLRTQLEEKLLHQFAGLSGEFLLIRGTAEAVACEASPNVKVLDLASSEEIREYISASEIVISRSGYSSVMDYAALGNNALLIPTPGQPEQEYLARYLLSRGYFYYAAQEFLNLEDDLEKATEFKGIKNLENSEPDWEELFQFFR